MYSHIVAQGYLLTLQKLVNIYY